MNLEMNSGYFRDTPECFEHVAVAVEARMDLKEQDASLDDVTVAEAVRQGKAGKDAAVFQAHLDPFQRVYERTNEQLDLLYAYVKATDTDIRIFVQTGNWRCSNTGTGRPGPHTSEYLQSELNKMKEWQRDFDPGNRARG